MLLEKVLNWVLPLVTVAVVAFGIYWFRLFADIGTYDRWHLRPKRRRRRWRLWR